MITVKDGCEVPTGKVKWFDVEKGFGFIAEDDGSDVFVHAHSLEEGATALTPGSRVEFSVAQGRKGLQAMHVKVLEVPPSVAGGIQVKYRKPAEELATIVDDAITVLDQVSTGLRQGRYPDRRTGRHLAAALRAIAQDVDGEGS